MDSTTTLITAVNHSQYPTEQDDASGGSDAMMKDDEQTSSAVDAAVKADEQTSSAAVVKADEQTSSAAAVKADEQTSSAAAVKADEQISSAVDTLVKDDEQTSSVVDSEVKDEEQTSSVVDSAVKDEEQTSSVVDSAEKDDEQTSSAEAKDESAYGENDVAKDEQTNAIANQEITSGEVAAEKGEEVAVMIDDSTGVDSDVTKDSSNTITHGDHSTLLSVSVNGSGGLIDGTAHSQQPDHGFDIQDVSKEVLEMKAKEEASSGDNNILLEDISEQWELKAEKEKQSQAIDVQLVMNSIGLTQTDLSELNAGEAWEVKLNDGKREEERRNQVAMEALGFTSKELDRMKGEEAWETKIDPEEIKALHVDNDSVDTKKSRCVIS